MKKIILILLLSLVMINFVSAGNEIINYTAKIIYDDCNGKDIDASPLGLTNTVTQESIPVIKWKNQSYEYSLLRLVEIIIQNEPYGVNLVNKEGMTLLTCGDHKLTANFYTYKWDGERIDPFIYNTNLITNQVISQIANLNGSYKAQLIQNVGNNNTNENNQYNLFSDNNFYLTLGLSIGLSLISITIFELGLKFYKRRKHKQTSKKEAS